MDNPQNSPQISTITSSPTGIQPQTIQVPKKSHSWFAVITIILVAAALAGGWFANQQFNAMVLDSTEVAPPLTPQPKTEKISEPRYYLASTFEEEKSRAVLYRTSLGGEEADQLVANLEAPYLTILGNYVEPDTYLVYRGEHKLEIFDAKTGELELLFDIPVTAGIRKVALSSDKKLLAYALSTEGTGTAGEGGTSEIWTYNLETKQQQQIVESTPVGLYQGFSIEGWRDDNKQLVISNVGGDAGQTWGEIALVNVETGAIEKLEVAREAQEMDFLRGRLSPDGNMWLYQHCETPLPTDGLVTGCPEGVELRTYNFATKQVKTIYRNLRFEDNTDKAALRTIISMIWQDDRTAIVAVPGATILVSADTSNQTQELFSYDRVTPMNYQNNFVQLHYADEQYVFYQRGDDAYVYDKTSKKITGINIGVRNESFSYWLH